MTEDAPVAADAAAPEPVSDAEQPPPPPAPSKYGAVVGAWVDARLRNSPLSRATEAWNCLQAALPALITNLEEA